MGNPVVHFEIGCKDKPKTTDFYRQMFDWDIEEGPMGIIRTNPDMKMFAAEDAATGLHIGGHISALGHEPDNYTIFYVRVDDVPATIKKAESLGGKQLVPEVPLPFGSFAWIADPEGNTVGLVRINSSHQNSGTP